MVYFFI